MLKINTGLLILAVLASACIAQPGTGTTGRTVFGITDAAMDMGAVSSVMVTVDAISAHNMQTDAWVTVSSETQTFDLLKLKSENSIELAADANIPIGRYNQVRLEISKVMVTANGTVQEAKLPSSELKINTDLEVKANTTSAVTFDFIADESLHTTGEGKIIMAPVIQITAQKDADVEVDSSEKVTIKSGTTTHSAKVGMDINGNIGVGLKIKVDDDLDIGSDGKIKVGLGGSEAESETTITTENVVEITSDGFEPKTLTIDQGEEVVFVNRDSAEHWPASATHPTHTVYPGSGIEKCGSGEAIFDACEGLAEDEEFRFAFNEIGSWNYHDHLNPSLWGTIVVEE